MAANMGMAWGPWGWGKCFSGDWYPTFIMDDVLFFQWMILTFLMETHPLKPLIDVFAAEKTYDFPLPKLITRRECMIIHEYAMLPRML